MNGINLLAIEKKKILAQHICQRKTCDFLPLMNNYPNYVNLLKGDRWKAKLDSDIGAKGPLRIVNRQNLRNKYDNYKEEDEITKCPFQSLLDGYSWWVLIL